jgi:hypothetical protein
MKKTEKKYWVNGHHVRGKDFHTLAVSYKNNAVLFCFSFSLKYISFQFFQLT